MERAEFEFEKLKYIPLGLLNFLIFYSLFFYIRINVQFHYLLRGFGFYISFPAGIILLLGCARDKKFIIYSGLVLLAISTTLFISAALYGMYAIQSQIIQSIIMIISGHDAFGSDFLFDYIVIGYLSIPLRMSPYDNLTLILQTAFAIIILFLGIISYFLKRKEWVRNLRSDYGNIRLEDSGEITINNRPLRRHYPYLTPIQHENIIPNQIDFTDEFNNRFKTLICPNCGNRNFTGVKICAFCKSKFPICIICKLPISKKDFIKCPTCNVSAHKSEFLEWLKVKASCPHCKTEMDMWEFQEYLKGKEKKVELQIECPWCKNNIPEDADFCTYCGTKLK